ncbi:MAG: CdaR family protein [Lachnospiraceae bacterium]|nr:CdaR family protein [Lachnospiraceae bacterium]
MKIISVIGAVIIWFLVVNINDPTVSRKFTDIPVQISNGDKLLESGKVYMVQNKTDRVTVTVTQKRSVVEKLKNSDFTAIADMSHLSYMDNIAITVTCLHASVSADDMKISPNAVNLKVEAEESVELPVSVTTDGTTPANGYIVGPSSTDITGIVVYGPKSLINKLDKVVAHVDVSNLAASKTFHDVVYTVYDRNEEKVDDSLTRYLKFSTGKNTLSVTVEIWKVKEKIPVEVEGFTGSVAEGYMVAQVQTSPPTVSIAAPADVLSSVKSIQIPAKDVVLNGESESFKEQVDLGKYLPKNVILSKLNSGKVDLVVTVTEVASQTVKLETVKIKMLNKSDEYKVSFGGSETISISVRADETATKEITADSITASVDLKDYEKEGKFTLPLDVVLPSGYALVGNPQIQVNVTKISK